MGRRMKTKACTKCGDTKNINRFYKLEKGIHGVHSICKICVRSIYREKAPNYKRISKLDIMRRNEEFMCGLHRDSFFGDYEDQLV